MAPQITLYILGGCVAVAAVLFVVMIVLSVARPPRLPELSTYSQPLQRVIRALTPLPIATFEEANPKVARTMPPRPPPIAAHLPPPTPSVVARTIMPVAPSPAVPPPAAGSTLAPSPFVWTDTPSLPAVTVHRAAVDMSRAVSRPIYPARRSRKLRRFVIGVFITTTLAAAAVVAYPALLNPLCDDYEWFGSDAASVVRQQALDAHAAITDFISTL
jgi:hypothetical protein